MLATVLALPQRFVRWLPPVLFVFLTLATAGCLGPSLSPAPAPQTASAPASGRRLGAVSSNGVTPAQGWITFGGTATSSPSTIVPAWATSTVYAAGAVTGPNNLVCLCTTGGTSSSAPTAPGTGIVDGTVRWSCWYGTSFHGIIIGNTDASNALFVGNSTVAASGVASGWSIPAGSALTLPSGLNFNTVYWMASSASVVGTVALSY